MTRHLHPEELEHQHTLNLEIVRVVSEYLESEEVSPRTVRAAFEDALADLGFDVKEAAE